MIREITKPEISPAFTVSDIHKVREWHYEMLKDATVQERLDFYNRGTRFSCVPLVVRHKAIYRRN
jgi:hypothetical protein